MKKDKEKWSKKETKILSKQGTPPLETNKIMKKFFPHYYGHPAFYTLVEELKEIHSSKNHDYAGDGSPLRNFEMSEEMGIPAWKGCLVRMSDKFSRLCSFAKKQDYSVTDESFEDTLKDLAVYSLICIILHKWRRE